MAARASWQAARRGRIRARSVAPALAAVLAGLALVAGLAPAGAARQRGAPPEVASATAPSIRRVLATFARATDASSSNVANFKITGPGGSALPIISASPVGTTQVLFTTGPQQAVGYQLVGPKSTSPPVGFTGSTTAEPALLGATSVSIQTVRLRFSQPMGPSAAAASAYRITKLGATGKAATLAIKAAVLEADPTSVLLTTGQQTGARYEVEAGLVTSATGLYLDPTASRAQFLGTPAVSTVPPTLLTAQAQGGREVVLSFDKPMGPTADDVASYTSSPGLFITGAARLPGLTKVVLTTGTQYAVAYSVTATGVADAGGTPINAARRSAGFTGSVPIGTDRPRLTSAGSTGTTSVVLQFSKPMADSALNITSYDIIRDSSTEVGGVAVTAARFTDDSRLGIELTTVAQSEVGYRVRVANVVDLSGLPLADRQVLNGVILDPTSAVFGGTPPAPGDRTDSDCDGLTDQEEARGYQVRIVLATGQVQLREVTSDPGVRGTDCTSPSPLHDADLDGVPDAADSDRDGLPDAQEKALVTDPRDDDTDDDGLTDFSEFNEIFSDPNNQDTDGDTLYDGIEVTFFRTSAILADTDGDQIGDGVEIGLSTRNPRIGDLPKPGLEVGNLDLGLDVRFVDSTGTESRQVDTKSVSSSLTQTDGQEFASTEARTIEAATKLSQTVGFEIGYGVGLLGGFEGSASFSATAEQSFSSSFLTSFTETSSRETQRAREESLGSEVAQSEAANRTREVVGARMQAAVTLKSTANIAFSIRNLQLSALIQDPQNPLQLTPVATLRPVPEPVNGFNLGPLVPERGPVIFENTQVFPKLVEDLMRNPRGLVLRFSNYDLVDELGRNFAFTSQEINDRTAGLVIDFGGFDTDGDGAGDLSESKRVATGTGRLVDTNGDGTVGEGDRRRVFDDEGRHLGITLRDALAAAGLVEYREQNPPVPMGLTQAQIDNSYSVITTASGGERIYRVRRTGMEPGVDKQWEILTPTGIDQTLTLDSLIMNAGQTFTLAFLQDTDQDRLPALVESINGCVDSPADLDGDGVKESADTDGDRLDDRFEMLVGWEVDVERRRQVRSRCSSEDTDGDGLEDGDEAPSVVIRDAGGLIDFSPDAKPRRSATGPADPLLGHLTQDPITDPTTADTDLDGLSDSFELSPFTVLLIDGTTAGPLVTSPERFDSDGDTASDGVEEAVGGNPIRPDSEQFRDNDGDGLVNALEETKPYEVKVRGVSQGGTCTSRCDPGPETGEFVTSNKNLKDSDGDGMDDGEERLLRTHPGRPDTDGDAISDLEEVRGFVLRDLGILRTEPLKADSDDDKRSDGAEADRISGGRHVVRVPGQAPFAAASHPQEPDTDLDQLVDGDEVDAGTDPANFNTDGDNRSDYGEVTMPGGGRRPTVPDLRVRVSFSGIQVDHDGDEADSAGDFTFAVTARDRNGIPICSGDGPCLADELERKPFTSANDGPYRIDLPACTDDEQKTTCRKGGGTSDEIQISSSHTLPLTPRTVSVGSVSTTAAQLESFAITGFVNENEAGGVDCSALFPSTQSDDLTGAGSGTVYGTDLVRPGLTSLPLSRSAPCTRTGEQDLTFTLLVSYVAE